MKITPGENSYIWILQRELGRKKVKMKHMKVATRKGFKKRKKKRKLYKTYKSDHEEMF